MLPNFEALGNPRILSIPEQSQFPRAEINRLLNEKLRLHSVEEKRLAATIAPLLENLGWTGELRHLCEALPFECQLFDIITLRDIFANLGYLSEPSELRLDAIDSRLLPCLFIPALTGAAPLVVTERQDNGFKVFNSAIDSETLLGDARFSGNCYFFSGFIPEENIFTRGSGRKWFLNLMRRFQPHIMQILLISFTLNIFAMASSLMMIAIYSYVIGASSYTSLFYLGIGMALSLAAEIILRKVRSNSLSYFGVRVDTIVSRSIFEHLLYLPPSFTERAAVSAQLARLKDFESLRDFFTGSLALTCLELPFTLMFIIAIGFLSGPLVFVPIGIVGLYALLIMAVRAKLTLHLITAARGNNQRQEFLMEAIAKLRPIRQSGGVPNFNERFRKISGGASLANFRSGMISQVVETFSYIFMILAGIMTLSFGVGEVISAKLSTGGLIATMMLTWRVLSPLQNICASMTRLEQLKSSIGQMQKLLNIAPERNPRVNSAGLNNISGKINYHRVSLRYSSDTDAALLGFSCQINPGEIIAIKGDNGSGKSSILKLLSRLYNPQAGAIRIDDIDTRQLDAIELRAAISYIPQNVDLFTGTIRENLQMVSPVASIQDIENAFKEVGVWEEVKNLPEGLDTMIHGGKVTQIPVSLMQGINIARAYLKNSTICIFDEPSNYLDKQSEELLMRHITGLRGKKTVLVVSHREDIMLLADKLLVMEKGELIMAGPPAAVLKEAMNRKVSA